MSKEPERRDGSCDEEGVEAATLDEKFPAGHVGLQHTLLTGTFEAWKKGGRLFSALLTINLLLLGCAMVSSGAVSTVPVQEMEVLAFLSTLMLLSSAWMLFYLLHTAKQQDDYALCKDSHAGPIWLRGGLAVFGVCTLVLDVFKIGYYIGYIDCESPIKILYPVVQAVFVIIQTYFLWVSAKDCVQLNLNVSRCGLMLTLATNLAVWMAAVTDESMHQTKLPDHDSPVKDESNPQTTIPASNYSRMANSVQNLELRAGGGSANKCGCKTNLCDIFQTGYYYLYPFNIEYSLFACAMAYVMWKNVGRQIQHHASHPKVHISWRAIFVGLVLGVCTVVAGLGIFIAYEVLVNNTEAREDALTMFYIFNIVSLSLMSVGALAGSVIYRLDDRHMDNHKNPTRTLDVALLLGAALGQYCISYYSIVAMVAIGPSDLLSVLNLVYSLLVIVQHTVQNSFIIEGLHRQPLDEGHPEHEGSPHSHREKPAELIYANPGASQHAIEGSTSAFDGAYGQEMGLHEVMSRSQAAGHHVIITSWKDRFRRALVKEISLFLLLSNIIFWIIPAFGGRPQFDHDKEAKFYGETMWIAIVNICLPFGIFYRMHAVASLVEVFIMS